jgi:hypothetical protein
MDLLYSIPKLTRVFLVLAICIFSPVSAHAQWPPTPPPYQSGNNFTVNGQVYQVTWLSTTGMGQLDVALKLPWFGAQNGVYLNGVGVNVSYGGRGPYPTGEGVVFDSSQSGSSTDAGDSNHLRRYIAGGWYVYSVSNETALDTFVYPITMTYQVTALQPYVNVQNVNITFSFGNGATAGIATPGAGGVYVAGNRVIDWSASPTSEDLNLPMAPSGSVSSLCTLSNGAGTVTVTLPNSGSMVGSTNQTLETNFLTLVGTVATMYANARMEVVPTAVTAQ